MPVVQEDINFYKSLNVPSQDGLMSGGGIDTASQLTDSSPINSLIPMLLYDIPTGSNKVWHYKMFVKNDSVDSNLINMGFYIANLVIDLPTTGGVSFVPAAAVTGFLKVDGFDSAVLPVTETIQLIGNYTVNSSRSYSRLFRVCYLDTFSNIAICPVDILIMRGATVVGTIPTGSYGANGELEAALDLAYNSDSSVADRLTAPTGLTFSRPNTPTTALALSSSTLSFGSCLGIWLKSTAYKGTTRVTQIQYVPAVIGDPEA
jgi:hypothetical protein